MPVPGSTRGEFIGPDLLAARTRMGLSQAELAVCLGLHWNTIARWERNESPVRHPEVREVAAVVADLRAELEAHLPKEERILFPFIAQLEGAATPQHPLLGHIASPIRVMEAEHEHAWSALAALRTLTSGYTPPADACATYREYYAGLSTLERELQEHIHLENYVLFPRAQALEDHVLGRA